MRRGMTITEVMVALGVVTLVASLLLVSLGRVQDDAHRVKCLAHAASCMRAVQLYASDFDDCFPRFAAARIEDAFSNGGISLSYYDQSYHWPLAVRAYLQDLPVSNAQLCPRSPAHRAIYAGDLTSDEYISQYPEGYVLPSEHHISYTCLTDWSVWTTGGDINDTSSLRVVRWSEAATPSCKGVLIEPRAYHLASGSSSFRSDISAYEPEGRDKAYTTMFADGHGRSVAFPLFCAPFTGNGIDPEMALPVLATEHGIRGQDVE